MILLFVSLIILSAGLLYLLKNEKIKQQFENHSWILMLLGVLLSSVSLIPFMQEDSRFLWISLESIFSRHASRYFVIHCWCLRLFSSHR
jgi:hypothetical protein